MCRVWGFLWKEPRRIQRLSLLLKWLLGLPWRLSGKECLPNQETLVQPLMQEDPHVHGAANHAPQLWVCAQSLCSTVREATPRGKASSETPLSAAKEWLNVAVGPKLLSKCNVYSIKRKISYSYWGFFMRCWKQKIKCLKFWLIWCKWLH